MVEEAGGKVTRFDGSPVGLRADEVVAANPALHEVMLEVLRAGVGSVPRRRREGRPDGGRTR